MYDDDDDDDDWLQRNAGWVCPIATALGIIGTIFGVLGSIIGPGQIVFAMVVLLPSLMLAGLGWLSWQADFNEERYERIKTNISDLFDAGH